MQDDSGDRQPGGATQQRYRRIAGNVSDLVAETDINGTYTYASPSYQSVLGYDPTSLLGRSLFEFIHLDDVNTALISFDGAIRGLPSQKARFRHLRSNGGYVWIEATGDAMVDSQGKIVGAALGGLQIAERESSLGDLTTHYALLQGIADCNSDAVLAVDSGRRIMAFNKRLATYARQFTGVDLRVGDDALDCVPEGELQTVLKHNLERALRGEQFVEHITWFKGRKPLHIAASHHPVTHESGWVIGVVVFLKDVTVENYKEELLRDRMQFQETLLRIIPAPVFYKDCNGVFLGVNTAWEEMTGLKQNNVIGRRASDVFPQDLAAAFEDADSALLSTKGMQTSTLSFPDPNGHVREVIIYRAPFVDRSGNVAGLVGIIIDVTDLKRAQDRLRGSLDDKVALLRDIHAQKTHFKQLFDYMPDAIAILDSGQKILEINNAFQELFGYDATETAGRHLFDLVVPESDVAESKQMFEQARLTGVVRTDLTRMRKDGSTFTASIAVSSIALTREETGTIAIYRDITDEKAVEARLRQLSRAVEQSPASIVITDTNGAITYVNPKFSEVTGYSADEVTGKNPRILKSGESGPAVYKELWNAIASGKTWQGEFHNKKKNGELYWESAHISAITDASGTITNYLAVKEDITGQKQIEAIRTRLEKELLLRNVKLEQVIEEMERVQARLMKAEKFNRCTPEGRTSAAEHQDNKSSTENRNGG